VEKQIQILPCIERVISPAAGYPSGQTGEADRRINISVISTSTESTIEALRRASTFANSLGARITLVVAQVVPYPLPLASPPVLADFNERRFRQIVVETQVEASVQIYLCRDVHETLLSVIPRGSIVVVGGRKRWWPTAERRLARKLRRAGNQVILTESE
jgi:hypothetical protein